MPVSSMIRRFHSTPGHLEIVRDTALSFCRGLVRHGLSRKAFGAAVLPLPVGKGRELRAIAIVAWGIGRDAQVGHRLPGDLPERGRGHRAAVAPFLGRVSGSDENGDTRASGREE